MRSPLYGFRILTGGRGRPRTFQAVSTEYDKNLWQSVIRRVSRENTPRSPYSTVRLTYFARVVPPFSVSFDPVAGHFGCSAPHIPHSSMVFFPRLSIMCVEPPHPQCGSRFIRVYILFNVNRKTSRDDRTTIPTVNSVINCTPRPRNSAVPRTNILKI